VHRALILGGGFGGIAAAVALRELADPADEIVLVERRTSFAMGLRKNWALVGMESHAVGERPIGGLESRGIRVIQGTVSAIDPPGRAADVDGVRHDADALVVALGAERAPDLVPGLREHALDVYSSDATDANALAIDGFAGGQVVVGIFGAPYPCPPGPFELAILLAERWERDGTRFGMLVVSPLPKSLPILGEAGCEAFDGRLSAAGVSFRPDTRATEVRQGEVVIPDGRIPFDLLLAVPPHRAPVVVADAGLTGQGGWIAVDARTLETRFEGVYAVGDVTAIPLSGGKALPKAGVFAQAEGEVVAARIADRWAGRQPGATFAGDGMCFVETGGGAAAMVRGGFLEDPPRVELTESSAGHLAAKRAFEADRLRAWFGR
jgi:sulfide:quinone oxidoreductase